MASLARSSPCRHDHELTFIYSGGDRRSRRHLVAADHVVSIQDWARTIALKASPAIIGRGSGDGQPGARSFRRDGALRPSSKPFGGGGGGRIHVGLRTGLAFLVLVRFWCSGLRASCPGERRRGEKA